MLRTRLHDLTAALGLAVALAACSDDPARVVTCADDTNCNLDTAGQCVQKPEATERHCAYPATTCPSGYAWSELSGPLSGECVRATFDVVFVDEWRFSISAPAGLSGFAYVVNTGADALDLSTLRVVSVTDDHPMGIVSVDVSPPDMQLPPGSAAMGATGTSAILDPLVPEPRTLPPEGASFALSLDGLPGGPLQSTFDIHATVTVSLEQVEVAVPVTMHMVSGLDPIIYVDSLSGARLAAFR